MFPRNENGNEGTFAKITLLRKPPFYLPMTLFGVDKRVVSKRVVSADVPPERKPERGYVRQNHPFTKPPSYLPLINFGRGEKTPTPKISALLRKRSVLLRADFVLTKDRKRPYYRHLKKIHREGSCSKAAGGP